MAYCNKQITATNILNNMSIDDLEYTLASCEQSCNKYYNCDTIAIMLDRLKELKGE